MFTRKLVLAAVVAVAGLAVTADSAKAQFYNYGYSYGYNPYAYNSYAYSYTPYSYGYNNFAYGYNNFAYTYPGHTWGYTPGAFSNAYNPMTTSWPSMAAYNSFYNRGRFYR